MKKIIKISLYSFLGIIFLAVFGSYIAYQAYWPEDPEFKIDSTLLNYYQESYENCRAAFLEKTNEVYSEFDSVLLGKIMVPSNIDNDLSVDWCYIPAQQSKEKLLIINSGLHGIEGYTGSAIQQMFMDKILDTVLTKNIGILLIHGLNPYGFKYHRKVTENNIDLNRNCMIPGHEFHIENAGYAELTNFLMPSKPVCVNNLRNQFFHLISIYKIIHKSMPVLRQAALQGQYEFKKGIYYGGDDYEPQIKDLQALLANVMKDYNTVLNLDLHTGYGNRGTLHLFIDKPEDRKIQKGLESVFNGVTIDWGSSDDFYTINGEYTTWGKSIDSNVLYLPMAFEYGTLNSQETFGSLKSIQFMILENQGAHYGFKNEKSEEKTKYLFDELYFPSSPVWRSKVLSDTYSMLKLMITNFEKNNIK